ncbi:MAG: glycosyltransferase family 4 protein [Candidatus Acidiferrales bacterium]
MRKIAFIAANEFVPWGGSEYLWAGAAEKLAHRGVEVRVSVKDWGRPVKQVEQLRAAGCRIFKRPTASLARRAIRKLPLWREYIRSHVKKVGAGADLVVISQGSQEDGLQWLEAARSLGYKYSLICQGVAEVWWPRDSSIDRLVKTYENACCAFFVSEANLALTRRQFVTPLANARVVRNPFNVPYDARPPWPLTNGAQLSLAFVSRLDPGGKGHDVLIETLSLPHWRGRDIIVSLNGNGSNERSLRRMVEQVKLKSIHFGGFSESIEQTWSNHHALILPSRYEGMPLVLVEAMLCGRPSIITDVGGVRELVRDGVNGFLAKAPTVELLDEAMNRAWENRHRLKEMGEQAAIDVRKFVSPDPVEDFVRQLMALANGQPK